MGSSVPLHKAEKALMGLTDVPNYVTMMFNNGTR